MKKRLGYSLIELLVTMSIIGVFLAIILPSFRASGPEKSIEQSSSQVQSYIRTAFSSRQFSSQNIAGITFTKLGNKIEIWKDNPPVVTATHYLPSNAVMHFTSANPSDGIDPPIFKITFDGNNKTYFLAGLNRTDQVTIDINGSSTKSTIDIDRITGVADVSIMKK